MAFSWLHNAEACWSGLALRGADDTDFREGQARDRAFLAIFTFSQPHRFRLPMEYDPPREFAND
jgi:hypothetical protein